MTSFAKPINKNQIDDLLDSLDSDETDWNRRSVLKILSMRNMFVSEIKQIEPYVDKLKRTSSILTTISTIMVAIGTSGTVIELVREIVIFRDGFIKPSVINMLVLVLSAIFDVTATSILAYIKSQDFSIKINVADECISELQYMIDSIDSQLYKKAKFRTHMDSFLKTIQHLHQTTTRKKTSVLDLPSYDLLEQAASQERKMTDMASTSDDYSTCD